MTTPREPEDAAPLSAEQEGAVRRLLADTAVDEPIPGDVAERLDATLHHLASEYDDRHGDRHGDSGPAAPISLAGRRRRRLAQVLVAAAAVAVVVGIGFQFRATDQADTMSAITDQDADRGVNASLEATADASGGDADSAAPGSAKDSRVAPGQRNDAGGLRATPFEVQRSTTSEPARTLRPARLRDDLIELRATVLPAPATVDYDKTTLTVPADFTCDLGDVGTGVMVGVIYRGGPALAAFREPAGTTQVAEVLQCGTGSVLRSVTVPAP